MKTRNIWNLVVAVAFILSTLFMPSANAAKAGAKCSKAGITTGTGAKKLTCVKKGKGFVWAKSPATSLGSASNPVPFGSTLKIGGIEYSLTRVNSSADQMICNANNFNKGCDLDANFNSIVDPNSPTTWVTVQITARNLGNQIVKPGGIDKNFFLVLSNGQLLERELFVVFPQSFYEVQMIPGGNGQGEVAFALPKSGASLSKLLVLRDSTNLFKTADYYFQVNW